MASKPKAVALLADVLPVVRPLPDIAALPVVLSSAKARAGACTFERKRGTPLWTPARIEVHRGVWKAKHASRDEWVHGVLAHEAAHAVCGYFAGHGETWQEQCLAFGGDGLSQVEPDSELWTFIFELIPVRAECTGCGETFRRATPFKWARARCPRCKGEVLPV